MDGEWDSTDLVETANKAFKAKIDFKITKFSLTDYLQMFFARFANMQSIKRSKKVGEEHYDVGNDLYKEMLGESMSYTCGYWRNGAKNLEEAQFAKMDLICRKVGLKAGDKVLDIGSGFGSLLAHAAKHYGAIGVGISVSKEQIKGTMEKHKDLPITTYYQDYREPLNDVDGKPMMFDHIFSVEMLEHVGYKNYHDYFKFVSDHLKPRGIFLLQVIGQPTSQTTNDAWTHKYIFPNSHAPSIAQIAKTVEGIFTIEDLHAFGTDYEPTTQAWYDNFMKAWPKLKELKNADGSTKYTERFRRMWEFYLLGVTGLSRSQTSSDWQIAFSKADIPGGYRSIR